MELYEAPTVYERVVYEDPYNNTQIRLTVSTFRGVEYLGLRKYYLDFEENWCPSSEGVSMPIDFDNTRELFSGLVEILSLAESKDIIEEHFQDLIDALYYNN